MFFLYLGNMYVTIMPVILAGIMNMIFTKTALYRRFKYPMDGGKNYSDGKRIFGDHKTWIGFAGMVVANIISQIAWGYFLQQMQWSALDDFYRCHENVLQYNAIIGFSTGFAYMLFELPNSFVKRRIGIAAGTTEHGVIGKVFFVIDQIDSLFGVALVLYLASWVPLVKCAGYIALGALTHISVNWILYRCKVRKYL